MDARRRFELVAALAGLLLAGSLLAYGIGLPPVAPSPTRSPPASVPSVSTTPETPVPSQPAGPSVTASVTGTTSRDVVPQWDPGPQGRHLRSPEGNQDEILEGGTQVYVVEQPVQAGGESWARVYVLPSEVTSLSDFYAWLPASALVPGSPAECPQALDVLVQYLARVPPPDRLRCWSRKDITVQAKTWFQHLWTSYTVNPSWFGNSTRQLVRISLVDPLGGVSSWAPHDGMWIDAQLGPDVPTPPLDFLLRVSGHFDDRSATQCQRSVKRTPPGDTTDPLGGLPDESPVDSQAWCRQQFVITSWQVVAGPEGRPLEPGVVQLHRTLPAPVCAGVGMGKLTFRLDAQNLDPIWLESDGALSPTIVPVFDPGFRAVTAPALAVLGPRGEVVARDGTQVDPDGTLAGYAICTMGEMVTFGP